MAANMPALSRRDTQARVKGGSLQACAAYRRNARTEQYEYVSPLVEQITGFSPDEMYAMTLDTWLARIHPDDSLRLAFEVERLQRGGRHVVHYRFRHKDGRYRWLADRVDVQPGSDKTACHRVGFLRPLGAGAAG